ncbi:MAG TPA: BatD family protein, partial [Thermoanaerobaculia bacterium]|nr:BatD family protein [Thermoanaerobaculia bacterium]
MRRAAAVLSAVFAAAVLFGGRAAAADLPSATATLSPSELSAGQTAVLQIEVNGSFRVSTAPVLPLTNLTVVAGPSLENRFEWINGRSSSRTVLVYQVRAGKPGHASVGAIRLVDGSGRAVTTAPITAEIRNGIGAEEPAAPETGGDPLLVSRLDPPAPYVGQQAVWTLYLVTRGQAERGEVESLPDFRGFWAEDLEREGNVQPQVWNIRGTLYRAYPMIRKALFATRAGRISIGPARARVSVRSSVFDVFDSPLADAAPIEKECAPLAVSPRPSPDPGLPVGKFALKLSLDRPRVAAGQAVAVTAQLSGDGRLADVAAPSLTVAGARVSEPETRLSIRRTTS